MNDLIHVIMFLCLCSYDVITEFRVNRCGKLCNIHLCFWSNRNIRYSTTFDQVQLFNYTALSVKVPSSPFTSFHTVLRVCHVCMFVSLFDFDLS